LRRQYGRDDQLEWGRAMQLGVGAGILPVELVQDAARFAWRFHALMNRSGALVPADVRVRLREYAPVFLQRGNQVRNELDGHDDLRSHRRAHDVLGLGFLDLLLRQRHYLAEGEREVAWSVCSRCE